MSQHRLDGRLQIEVKKNLIASIIILITNRLYDQKYFLHGKNVSNIRTTIGRC